MKERAKLAIAGCVMGLINGFLGGGGGIFAVLAFNSVLGLSQKVSQATAICTILPLCVVSSVIYAVWGNVDWQLTLFASIGVTTGGVLGATLLKRFSSKSLKTIFGVMMVVAGVKMFF